VVFDHPLALLGLEEGAATIADRFLASRGAALTTGERAYLERMRASCLRLYEVAEIRPDKGLSLQDLWTEEIVQVCPTHMAGGPGLRGHKLQSSTAESIPHPSFF